LDVATFHASRRFAEVTSGRIAYYERGRGPAALFIHGVPLNGYHWRHVIDRLCGERRCIAVDLMGLGYSEIAPGQDVSFTAQAQMIGEVLDALGIDKVDLVSNDSGGAIAQIFAAKNPTRLSSLVLTNCDVHDNWPPPQVLPLIERARSNTIEQVFRPTLERPDLARARYANGEPVPLFRSFADPSVLTDEVIRVYLEPILSTPERIDAFQRYWLGFDNKHTVAIHDALKKVTVPTLIVWGLQDFFFDRKWAYWLKDTIPGARGVIEVDDARLFFPEDRPDALAGPILEFWGQVDRLA
jgi:pimeloyl-ACP methyl ester carboxylesterase